MLKKKECCCKQSMLASDGIIDTIQFKWMFSKVMRASHFLPITEGKRESSPIIDPDSLSFVIALISFLLWCISYSCVSTLLFGSFHFRISFFPVSAITGLYYCRIAHFPLNMQFSPLRTNQSCCNCRPKQAQLGFTHYLYYLLFCTTMSQYCHIIFA